MMKGISMSTTPTVSMKATIPNVTFKTRIRNEALEGDNPFEWKDLTTAEIFDNKKVVVFSLPGAFTPTCSTSHLPRYEALYAEFVEQGVDSIICLSVNDAFVMYQWGKSQNAENVFLLPDGNGEFSRKMGMLVDKDNVGFGQRIQCMLKTMKLNSYLAKLVLKTIAQVTLLKFLMRILC
jgi:peroxiredoxin